MTEKVVNHHLILTPYKSLQEEALDWYADEEIQYLVNGTRKSYSKEQTQQMYEWQKQNGELYYIELMNNGKRKIIGDVWLNTDDFAIVIDPTYQQHGFGKEIVQFFLKELRNEGKDRMKVAEVYPWNVGSNKLFQRLGFEETVHDGYSSYEYFLKRNL